MLVGCGSGSEDASPVHEGASPAYEGANLGTPTGVGTASSERTALASAQTVGAGAERVVGDTHAHGAPAQDVAPCRVVRSAELPMHDRQRRLTLLTLAGANPAVYAMLVEGQGEQTELLLLDASLGVLTRRVIAERFDAAVGLAGRVLTLSRGGSASSEATFRATWLGADGQDDVALPLPVPARAGGAVRRSVAGGRALFVWTDGRHPPLALPVHHDPDASGDARLRFDGPHALSPDVELADARAVQLLGVALDDSGFAAIVREGAAEAADSQVWLATANARVPVPALEDAADIEAMVIVDDEVWVVATFEFSRPLLLRIDATGAMHGEPTALAPGAALPAPFPAGDPARLLEEGTRLLLRRRNAMGDPLPPDTVLADRPAARLPADVVREGQRYLVVYQDRDEAAETWPLRFASLDCVAR
ncbi:MAG: hypothetical protein H6726_10740 [Sandaracinaceae bacterium]|nr:hypothetical protein [Sandaracinaceae bacterium]